MSWFQAQAACQLSGKRLPNLEEWLAAARGTPDPGAHAGTGGFCVTNAAGPRNPSGGTACVSAWGAQDMIGNLYEWTADWLAGLAADNGATSATWARTAYNGDGTWNITSRALDSGGWQNGVPAVAIPGGDWAAGTAAGRFALNLSSDPTNQSSNLGVRCVLSR